MAQSTRTGADVPASTLLAASSTPIQTGRRTRSGLIGVVRGTFVVPAVDTTPPVIAAVSPTPGVLPGAAGGFSANFTVAQFTPVVIDVTDAGGLAAIYLTDGEGQTVYRASNYQGDYVSRSVRTNIANGYRLSILPGNGWPAPADKGAQSTVTVKVDAIDVSGNLTTATFNITLPAPALATVTPPVLAVGAMDLVAQARSRMCQQFRSNDP